MERRHYQGLPLRAHQLTELLLASAERGGDLRPQQGAEHRGGAHQELRPVAARRGGEAEELEGPAPRRHLAEGEVARDPEHVAGPHHLAHRQRPVREHHLDRAFPAQHHAVLRRPRVHVRRQQRPLSIMQMQQQAQNDDRSALIGRRACDQLNLVRRIKESQQEVGRPVHGAHAPR